MKEPQQRIDIVALKRDKQNILARYKVVRNVHIFTAFYGLNADADADPWY